MTKDSKDFRLSPAPPGRQFVSATPILSRGSDVKSEWLEAFERDFWPNYPRRVGKPTAKSKWGFILPKDESMRDKICEGLDRWKSFWEENDTDRRFIPHPATWLHQQRWDDEP